jgi:hypothetical protein
VNGDSVRDDLRERVGQRRPSHGATDWATTVRMRETASPSRKIWTSCPASAKALAWWKGNAAWVGSAEPQALLMRTLGAIAGPAGRPTVSVGPPASVRLPVSGYAQTRASRPATYVGWRWAGLRLMSGRRYIGCVTHRTSCSSSNITLPLSGSVISTKRY